MNKQFSRIVLSGILATGVALCGAAPTFAQGGGGGGRGRMDPDAQLQQYTQKYNLTADQQAQIKPLLQDQATKSAALRADQNADPQDRRTKMMALRADTNTKIRAILTADQQKQWDTDQAAMQ
ncbi:MAG TPA: hypothetical protein VHX11_07585, partial [Acidobacteriaceae bacterium]|nr:hypothetical protein [Acidobacteriaceae bacterium]